MQGAEDGVLLVFNDVFQPLTDSIQQRRLLSIGTKQQQESVLLSFVRVDGTVSYLWGIKHAEGTGRRAGEVCRVLDGEDGSLTRVTAKAHQLFSVSLYKIPSHPSSFFFIPFSISCSAIPDTFRGSEGNLI